MRQVASGQQAPQCRQTDIIHYERGGRCYQLMERRGPIGAAAGFAEAERRPDWASGSNAQSLRMGGETESVRIYGRTASLPSVYRSMRFEYTHKQIEESCIAKCTEPERSKLRKSTCRHRPSEATSSDRKHSAADTGYLRNIDTLPYFSANIFIIYEFPWGAAAAAHLFCSI